MKKTILLISGIILFITGYSQQQQACRQDTVYFLLQGHRGSVSWQKSITGNDWTSLEDANRDTLQIIASTPAWFRSEVIEGTCKPILSDAIYLLVHELPVVTIQPIDSVCIQEAPFNLAGGTPEGGMYWGDGIKSGKFNPSGAGPGKHQVFYRYRDPQTSCTDTATTFIEVIPKPDHAQTGGDLKAIAADSVRLNANTPVAGKGRWTIVNGINGHFSDPEDPNTWFVKDSSNLNFTLRWTISNKCGSYSNDIILSFLELSTNPCPGTPIVTDADGNIYPTIQISNQCWMAKNLNVGKMVVSTKSDFPHSQQANNGVTEKYCFNNDPFNCELYGGLYEREEGMNYSDSIGGRGICPAGWHLPTDADWKELNRVYKYNDAGAHLKTGGDSGFEALFAGDRHAQGEFFSFGATGFFLESGIYTYQGADDAFVREVAACNSLLARQYFSKKTGVSVRCVKNK